MKNFKFLLLALIAFAVLQTTSAQTAKQSDLKRADMKQQKELQKKQYKVDPNMKTQKKGEAKQQKDPRNSKLKAAPTKSDDAGRSRLPNSKAEFKRSTGKKAMPKNDGAFSQAKQKVQAARERIGKMTEKVKLARQKIEGELAAGKITREEFGKKLLKVEAAQARIRQLEKEVMAEYRALSNTLRK